MKLLFVHIINNYLFASIIPHPDDLGLRPLARPRDFPFCGCAFSPQAADILRSTSGNLALRENSCRMSCHQRWPEYWHEGDLPLPTLRRLRREAAQVLFQGPIVSSRYISLSAGMDTYPALLYR